MSAQQNQHGALAPAEIAPLYVLRADDRGLGIVRVAVRRHLVELLANGGDVEKGG